MATVIKEPAEDSPGIAIITSNELFNGIVGQGQRARHKIMELRDQRRWIFGVHVNGSLHGKKPEFPSYISFVLCGDANADFIRHVTQPILEWSAEYFVSPFPSLADSSRKEWDLLIVSRIAEAKRFSLSIEMLVELLKLKPDLRVNIIATYLSSLNDENVYVKKIAAKMRGLLPYEVSINAIDSSLFGLFPLTSRQILFTLAKSRGILITSEFEGGPRILSEAASLKVPIYVCEDLKSNLQKHFYALNVKKISTSPTIAAQQLKDYLNISTGSDCSSDAFISLYNRDRFRADLERMLNNLGYGINGKWYLDDLNVRLPGHSRMGNIQILYDEGLFLDWCNWIETQGGEMAAKCLNDEGARLLEPVFLAMRRRLVRNVQMAMKLFRVCIGKCVSFLGFREGY